jgi:hypothetical protein
MRLPPWSGEVLGISRCYLILFWKIIDVAFIRTKVVATMNCHFLPTTDMKRESSFTPPTKAKARLCVYHQAQG